MSEQFVPRFGILQRYKVQVQLKLRYVPAGCAEAPKTPDDAINTHHSDARGPRGPPIPRSFQQLGDLLLQLMRRCVVQ